jgi:alcohol dehydrogenase class IV
VMKFNSRRRPGLYRRVGLACGLDVVRVKDDEADILTINFILDFIRLLGLNRGLHAFGVKESQISLLAEQAILDSCHRTNPVPVTVEDMKALFLAAL